MILHEKKIQFNLSGNEVFYTNYFILLVKNTLCRKLQCQKGFNSILISYEIKDLRFGEGVEVELPRVGAEESVERACI